MEQQLTIFLVIGFIQLSAFKGTHNVLRSPPPLQPPWALSHTGQGVMQLLFSISGLCFLFTLIFGFTHLVWWIPVVCLVIVFPFAYYLLIRPVTRDILPMTIGSILSILGAGLIVYFWFFKT